MMMQATLEKPALAERVAQFLYREAVLADEHRYNEWEALWAQDDVLYWVPMRPDADPTREVSYIYDNRARLASRIRQLNTGMRHAQAPQSGLRRIISNIEIEPGEGDEVVTRSNFILMESRRGVQFLWAGRTTHVLAPEGDSFRIRRKTINLVEANEPIGTLAFLI
ncbi:MAG: aromatic-ring-hydroxylating dioxygenase subunit beta [Sphingomonadales bacterium]|nr:aromatic-ring-hydroxylating dioxygenase subunit beta [Sphingomonadales bacterium]MBU3990949.1 aromatic-ring-hydroxylating dioxygenase subunit beta [Alphaproteobacteria bacterium]